MQKNFEKKLHNAENSTERFVFTAVTLRNLGFFCHCEQRDFWKKNMYGKVAYRLSENKIHHYKT